MNAPATRKQPSPGPDIGLRRFDHLELYVGNARQAARFYEATFGFRTTHFRGLETGSRGAASYVLQQGHIRLVLTSALSPEHPAAASVMRHGDGVAVIALACEDAAAAFAHATARGARAALAPRGGDGQREAAVHVYGDTVLKFVERHGDDFAPGFEPVLAAQPVRDVGLAAIDHVVANVEVGAMRTWADFFAHTLGFHELVHFDDKTIATEYSSLQSVVMQDPAGVIKFPINEPASGKRKSQIAEYLDFYGGPGVQHVACATGDIISTVRRLRENGVRFLRVPSTYYDELPARVGAIDEPIDELAELGILVDRESNGYLLQIFTQPVEDRPTLFFEIIQRRNGARGFGEGNFKALFESIEREQALRGNL